MRDTYFFDPQKAMRVALDRNTIIPINNSFVEYKLFDYSFEDEYLQHDYKDLQICYYGGELIENAPDNLINLPIESFYEFCLDTRLRLPQVIDFDGFDVSEHEKIEIFGLLKMIIENVFNYRQHKICESILLIKNAKLNFHDRLRVYIIANRHTRVMQYVAKSVANEFIEHGLDVRFEIEKSSMERLESYHLVLSQAEFAPHIIVNINHFNNDIISDDTFNFIWFQDPMTTLLDDSFVRLRSKDFVFSLNEAIDHLLNKKNIPFQRQGFCLNSLAYNTDISIKRKDKIVFIGSSYIHTIPQNNDRVVAATRYLSELYHHGENLNDFLGEISKKFQLDQDFVFTRFLPYVVRDCGLLEISRLNTKYELEIYGWGWDVYEELKPYYRGILKYGEEIAQVYREAKYVFAPHLYYTLQQRTLEAVGCGAIPIVYDCLDFSHEKRYDEALCYYRSKNDLVEILKSEVQKKDFSNIINENSYKAFIIKILDIVRSYSENA